MAQIEADVETQTRNRETALAAAGARDVNALVALQSRLAQAYLDSSVRYWSTCAQLARDTQAEIAGILFARLDEWGRATQGAFPVPAAMPSPLATALDAARASQEAMLKSVAALASAGGVRRDKAA
jgi:hypothetical protein